MSEEDFEECQFTDGLYQKGHPECEACSARIRSACRVFSIYNGVRDPEYYCQEPGSALQNNNEKPMSRSISLAEMIKRSRKQ